MLGALWVVMAALVLVHGLRRRLDNNRRQLHARGEIEYALQRDAEGRLSSRAKADQSGQVLPDPGVVVFRGEHDTVLSRAALYLVHACSISLVITTIIILIDYYYGCQLQGIDNLWCARAPRGRPDSS